MSLSKSEVEKRWMLKQQIPPWHASCQLNMLLVTTAADCYCKYSRMLDPGHGSARTDIRQETDGTQQEHWQCLLLDFLSRHGYHTKCKASDACYRWQRTVPVDVTCICLPAWLADNSLKLKLNTATTKPCHFSSYKAAFICTVFLQRGESIL